MSNRMENIFTRTVHGILMHLMMKKRKANKNIYRYKKKIGNHIFRYSLKSRDKNRELILEIDNGFFLAIPNIGCTLLHLCSSFYEMRYFLRRKQMNGPTFIHSYFMCYSKYGKQFKLSFLIHFSPSKKHFYFLFLSLREK